MAPRFDPESLRLDLSVADLLESPFLRSLGFSSRGGYERLWLGQAIHGRYQEQKLQEDPSYRREVVISHVFEHRGWRVTVQGRADGLRREAAGRPVGAGGNSGRGGGGPARARGRGGGGEVAGATGADDAGGAGSRSSSTSRRSPPPSAAGSTRSS